MNLQQLEAYVACLKATREAATAMLQAADLIEAAATGFAEAHRAAKVGSIPGDWGAVLDALPVYIEAVEKMRRDFTPLAHVGEDAGGAA